MGDTYLDVLVELLRSFKVLDDYEEYSKKGPLNKFSYKFSLVLGQKSIEEMINDQIEEILKFVNDTDVPIELKSQVCKLSIQKD